jgi:hypothetical protein
VDTEGCDCSYVRRNTMARRATLTVQKDLPLAEDRWHLVEVVSIDVRPRQKETRVTLRHSEGDQEGRVHILTLQLPLRPSNKAGEFFHACGFDVAEGGTIESKDAIGQRIEARFRVPAQGEPQVVAIRRPCQAEER